jgi:hypothetical protein
MGFKPLELPQVFSSFVRCFTNEISNATLTGFEPVLPP